MERFVCSTKVVSGTGALEALAEYRCKKMLVVARKGEFAGQIVRAAGNPQTEIVEDMDGDPDMKQAVEGSRTIKAFRPNLVVAAGGRGELDSAKAMVCFSGHSCPLAVIPMAPCGGSEVTDRVILTHNGCRHLLRNDAMVPDLAILEPMLTEKTPAGIWAEGGFEILAAVLESYTVSGGGMLRDLHAREAFAACWAALPAAFSGSVAARHRLLLSSVMTGLAVKQTGLGLCAAMENALGVVFGLSRGKAAGMLLPVIIGCNAHAAGRRYAELSRTAGMGGSREEIGSRNLRTGLIRLRRELGLPGSLVQAGQDIRSVWNSGRQAVQLTLEDPECRNNPVAVDDFFVRRILEEITGRI